MLLLTAGWLALTSRILAGGVAQAEKQAIETARQFVAAAKKKDVAGALRHADAPWWQDERSVVKTRADLQKHFQERFGTPGPIAKLKFEIVSSLEWARLRKILSRNEVEQGDTVFRADDFLVFVGSRSKDEPSGYLIIRIRGGKAAVAGAKALGGL